MRDIVRRAVGPEEEAAGADDGNIVSCCDPELEEVEQAERSCECKNTPDRIAVPSCLRCEYQRCGESKAQAESLSADAGQRSLATREQGGIERDRPAGEGTLNLGSEVRFAVDGNIMCRGFFETMDSLSFRGRG